MAENWFVDTGMRQSCPKCGNSHRFKAVSAQVAEDCCECWIECRDCGYAPAVEAGDCVEDVWGDVSPEAIPYIFRTCWLEALAA